MKEKLIELNNKILELNNGNDTYEKHVLIKKILSEKNCFLKMSIEQSYAILRDLGINENELKDVYLQLINIEK